MFVSFEDAVDPPPHYNIGDSGPAGGLVFYDKGSYSEGWRYLEAASLDVKVGESDYNHLFGFYRTTSTGSNELVNTAIDIGTGQANTTALVSKMGSTAYIYSTGTDTTEQYAARLCDTYTVGTYTDWFLPSRDELNQMYLNLKMEELGGIFDGMYWSSSENPLHVTYASVQDMGTGNQGGYTRDLACRVRPIRAF